MTVNEYNSLLARVGTLRLKAREIEDEANALEALADKIAGLKYVVRDKPGYAPSGYAPWQLAAFPNHGFFATPQDALRALNGGTDD